MLVAQNNPQTICIMIITFKTFRPTGVVTSPNKRTFGEVRFLLKQREARVWKLDLCCGRMGMSSVNMNLRQNTHVVSNLGVGRAFRPCVDCPDWLRIEEVFAV